MLTLSILMVLNSSATPAVDFGGILNAVGNALDPKTRQDITKILQPNNQERHSESPNSETPQEKNDRLMRDSALYDEVPQPPSDKQIKSWRIQGLNPKRAIHFVNLTPAEHRAMGKCYDERLHWKTSDRMNYCGFTYRNSSN
ncbi:MAG: hypothetical protein ACXWT1_03990 [Methylobacter sp.]